MIQHSGEHLGGNPAIDEIIMEIRSRFSNVMPGALQVPERVRKYVHEALEKTGTLSDEGVIDAFIESMISPDAKMILTKEIIELIQSKLLTDEQIGRILEHLKNVQKEVFLRIVGSLFDQAERRNYGIKIHAPPQKSGIPKLPRKPKKPKPTPETRVILSPIQKHIEKVRQTLVNQGHTIDKTLWNSYMRNIGLGNRPAKAGAINITPEDLAPIIGIIQLLLEKYPEWDAECIPIRIRNFIFLLIEKNYFHESEGNIDVKTLLAQAFQQIPKDKKTVFIHHIFGSDVNKMLKITQVERKRKTIYHGYTKTLLPHSILEVLFIAGILDENQKNIYVRAMRERIQELKEEDTHNNEEYSALEKFLRDETQRNLSQR